MEKFETHMFRYRHEGAEWVLTLKATDAEDARARIAKLAYAHYDGVVIAEMPAALAPIGIISVWARNAAMMIVGRFFGAHK